MGHFESSSSIWDEGEVPSCDICKEPAIYDTPMSGVQLCANPECHTVFVEQHCEELEYVEEGE